MPRRAAAQAASAPHTSYSIVLELAAGGQLASWRRRTTRECCLLPAACRPPARHGRGHTRHLAPAQPAELQIYNQCCLAVAFFRVCVLLMPVSSRRSRRAGSVVVASLSHAAPPGALPFPNPDPVQMITTLRACAHKRYDVCSSCCVWRSAACSLSEEERAAERQVWSPVCLNGIVAGTHPLPWLHTHTRTHTHTTQCALLLSVRASSAVPFQPSELPLGAAGARELASCARWGAKGKRDGGGATGGRACDWVGCLGDEDEF